ncbi:MAG: type II toxin-antitoxin system RelE/ParE family toxin [Isosphaeraceae bacterium]|jgi:hypothetical protein
MLKTFIESGEFSAWVKSYFTDDHLAAMQRELLAEPEIGDVIPGCGGLRKLRVADPKRGKGKRGGARVVYLHIAGADQIYLITVYGKDQKDDLSADDKKLYRQLVQMLKDQARRPEGE